MKKLLFSLLICITLFSCEKEPANNNINDPSISGSIEYKINGQQVKIINSNSTTLPISTVSGVHFNVPPLAVGYNFSANYSTAAASTNEKTKFVLLSIGLDSMITGITYSLPSTRIKASITDNNYSYFAWYDEDKAAFSITITKHQNGLISGLFFGKFEKRDFNNDYGFVDITEGKFTDVRMVY